MAKMIKEIHLDDLDGSIMDQENTVRFAIDGTDFEIDLKGENEDELRKVLAPFITKARAVRHQTGRRARGTGTTRSISREKSGQIRQWAKSNGLPVSERGRIAQTVVDKYEAAN